MIAEPTDCHPWACPRRRFTVDPADLQYEALKREWTDQYVEVNPERPELKRFAGIVGRVITVNFNLKALVDFQDGGWYDITASGDCLRKLDPATAKAKYKGTVNSAQPFPEKQG
jgi:hypothetical protein